VAEQAQQITVVGNFLETPVGTHLMVRGSFIQHPKFGRQFSAKSVTETTPSTPEGIITYLSSGLIPGIGEKTATRIVKAFGDETLEVIHRDPERLAKLSGVGKKKAQAITEALAQQHDTRAIMQFLLEHNISPRLATKIKEKYDNRAVEVLSRDPYILARDIRGIGFSTADTIAMNLGIKPDSPARLKAGIYYAIEKASEDGHSYLPLEAAALRARSLLQIGEDIDLSPFVTQLVQEGYLVQEEDALYVKHLLRAEQFVADFIAGRAEPVSPQIDPALIEQNLNQAESELGIQFSAEQRQAVHFASTHRLMVITGGPGCGKTTIIRALAAVFTKANKRLLLAAPTGRASQRMAQVTGLSASTIHRMLRYDPITHGFFFGLRDPLPADAVIIDEASMIDVLLAKDLCAAVPANATLIFVGDRDQLPSVGPGRIFSDLISSNAVKVISLSRLFRRSEESSINSIAHLINSGSVPDIPQPDGVTKTDAYFLPRSDASEAAELIERLVADQIPKKFQIAAQDIVVLTPSNRGPMGTQVLNERLQQKLNPRSSEDEKISLPFGELRIGDRVCQRVNNYQIDDLGVFNGDIGYIYSINKEEKSLVVEMWDGRLVHYDSTDMTQLSLAYAITVHRSQGSEIPCVVLALHDSHYTLLERQLLYTAVTRAKKLLIVVGSKRALAIASKKASTKQRLSKLVDRIRKGLS
jgi:exodeoxyribonuclease V alpha subunit